MLRVAAIRTLAVAALVAGSLPVAAAAQDQTGHAGHAVGAPLPLSQDEIVAYARLEIAIGVARDSAQAQLAQARNKTHEAQAALQEKLLEEIEQLRTQAGISHAEYNRRAFLVMTDPGVRRNYDSVYVALTGAPLPGQAPAAAAQAGRGAGAAAPAQQVAVPPGPAGVHIGHVVNSFGDTPNMAGLLPTALAEARIASQHANLAARNPTDLANMKLHAGHVLHAMDPTVEPMGPGQGYGVKKAAAGVVSHIELAAAANGASAAVTTHAVHIATSARNVGKRVDQVIALAKQIQGATDAAAAAALLNQVVSLCQQIIEGADANNDGRVTWQEDEGGLQQAEEHVGLMLRG